MYSEIYCKDEANKEKSLELLEQGIGYAVENDMYVLVDWHILNDSDPNINLEQALEFFKYISEKYADEPAVLYEICNEPNGNTSWSDICRYADEIIPEIRKYSPDSVIIIGTPDYDRGLYAPVMEPLKYDNIMYTLHFYAGTHHDGLRRDAQYAISHGLPVFVTECGITEASGNGPIDYASAVEWFKFLNENNISYAVWSMSNKDETSAMFIPTYEPTSSPTDQDLTESGYWVRQVISGTEPSEAAVRDVNTGFLKRFHALISGSLGDRGIRSVSRWNIFAVVSLVLIGLFALSVVIFKARRSIPLKTYEDILKEGQQKPAGVSFNVRGLIENIALITSIFLTIIYYCWRLFFSVPVGFGAAAVISNLVLLIVEITGFGESLILYYGLMKMKRYPVPGIEDDQYPDVDIFIASYNEPEELLKKTINGCLHLKYPDKSKVHIWMCDDNRRANIRQLCEDMGIGYFDRPDNEGAKAGNLNHAMSLTNSPYVVTLDADMIPKSDFLLKTIPYFVDAKLRMKDVKEEERIQLGFLQTPQSFYTPDIFQYALYSERRAPNEQDFFYRTIEVSKTATNSVIYGGSNTVLSRKALEDVGGFYTGSITEDFATGFLIEQKGYVSLATPEPLASGQTPCEYKDHIKQRIRWGRGVIATAKQLHILKSPDMTVEQKLSYLSSVSYWYSSLKTLIYILSPLMFAVFAIPVF
ncbi:MAG: cellulase family glycosylhydrolase, partial [Lachnospiraceae bacterium]|nr:cellulase family glycosylhydrolase [Lachnospiraceae bacterium]